MLLRNSWSFVCLVCLLKQQHGLPYKENQAATVGIRIGRVAGAKYPDIYSNCTNFCQQISIIRKEDHNIIKKTIGNCDHSRNKYLVQKCFSNFFNPSISLRKQIRMLKENVPRLFYSLPFPGLLFT